MSSSLELQLEVNLELSSQFREKQWIAEYHEPNLQAHPEYVDLLEDLLDMAGRNLSGLVSPEKLLELVTHTMYVVTTYGQNTMSLATLVSILERRLETVATTYEDRATLLAEWVATWAPAGLYDYKVTSDGYPLLVPLVAVPTALQEELDRRFKAPLAQLTKSVGELEKDGAGLVTGLRFTGKSSKRKIPLNKACREYVTMLSKIPYAYDWALISRLEYQVPHISKEGQALTDKERVDCRTGWERFVLAAELGLAKDTLSLPTSLDSRNRIYSIINDPIIRQCLRSPVASGNLTPFEKSLLGN